LDSTISSDGKNHQQGDEGSNRECNSYPSLDGNFEWNKVLNALEIHSRLLLKVSKPATN